MKLIATVNWHGPKGEFVLAGHDLPADLDEEHRTSLLETGGAAEVDDDYEPQDITTEDVADLSTVLDTDGDTNGRTG